MFKGIIQNIAGSPDTSCTKLSCYILTENGWTKEQKNEEQQGIMIFSVSY